MNYFRRWCAIVAASLALAASLISSAASQSPDSWARCKGNDPTAQIISCSAIIGASKGAPNDLATAFDNRGTAYYRTGRYDLAIEDYNQAIRLNANEAALFLHRGAAYREWSANDRAIEDFNQAVKLDPTFADGFASRGNVYYRMRQYDRVIADESKAIELNPKLAFAFTVRGLAYAAKGQYDRAVEDYDQALKLDPGDTVAPAMRRLAEAAKQGSNPGVAPSTPTAPGRAAEAVLTSSEVAGVFAQSAPRYLQALLKAPPVGVADSYFSVRYKLKDIHQFAKAGARVVVILNGTPHAITKENADAYIEGYSGTLALHEQAIEQRGFRQVGGNFAMKVVGPTCGQQGFADATVSIVQNQYRLTLEKGWPTQYEGLIIEDTIAIAAPGSYNRGVIGQGKVKADLTEINFGNCTVILSRP